MTTRTVGYSSDSWASCFKMSSTTVKMVQKGIYNRLDYRISEVGSQQTLFE